MGIYVTLNSIRSTMSTSAATPSRGSGSCHSCKSTLISTQYVTCTKCQYRYCNRNRCITKMGGSWASIQDHFTTGKPCPHCVANENPEQHQCVNTNCQNKRKRQIYEEQMLEQEKLAQYMPYVQQPLLQQGMHAIPLQYGTYPLHHMQQPMYPAVSMQPMSVQQLPMQQLSMQPNLTGIPGNTMSQNTMLHNMAPILRQSSANLPSHTTSTPNISMRSYSDTYNMNAEYDKILDTFASMNSVQLYITTSSHTLFAHTLIPQLIQQYNIHGSTLLTTVTLELLQANNYPVDSIAATMNIISRLIQRQYQRIAAANNTNTIQNNIPQSTTSILRTGVVSPDSHSSKPPNIPVHSTPTREPLSAILQPPTLLTSSSVSPGTQLSSPGVPSPKSVTANHVFTQSPITLQPNTSFNSNKRSAFKSNSTTK